MNNGEQEQYAEPGKNGKRKNRGKIVKRTILVAGLALAVYMVYSIVYLFVSPDRNIQQSIWYRRMLHLSFNHQLRLKIGENLAEVRHGSV